MEGLWANRGDHGDVRDARDNYRYACGDRDDHRHHRHNREDDVTRKVKIETPTFDGTYDRKFFSDWLVDMVM